MTRDEVLDAIRAGYITAPSIARYLGGLSGEISNILYKMREIGRVSWGPVVEASGSDGRPPRTWIINEAWTSRRGSPESLAKTAASRRANADGEKRRVEAIRQHYAVHKPIPVPPWVAKPHRRVYREITRVLGEETAAQWARKAKQMSKVA